MAEWVLEPLCRGSVCLPRGLIILALALVLLLCRVAAEACLRQVARDVGRVTREDRDG
jgi:hypothetical protein